MAEYDATEPQSNRASAVGEPCSGVEGAELRQYCGVIGDAVGLV
jgi:hypothetical protein